MLAVARSCVIEQQSAPIDALWHLQTLVKLLMSKQSHGLFCLNDAE